MHRVVVDLGARVQLLLPSARAVECARAALISHAPELDWEPYAALDVWDECAYLLEARVYLTAGALPLATLAGALWPAVRRAAGERAYTLAHVHDDGTLEMLTSAAPPSPRPRSTLMLMR